MTFDHDPKHDPHGFGGLTRARRAEMEQRLGHSGYGNRTGIGLLRRERRTRTLLILAGVVAVVAVVWIGVVAVGEPTANPEVGLEDNDEFVGAFSVEEAARRAAEALGTSRLFVAEEPAGGLQLTRIDIERSEDGAPVRAVSYYWDGLTHSSDEHSILVEQYPDGAAVTPPDEPFETARIAGSTVAIGSINNGNNRFYVVEGPHAPLIVRASGGIGPTMPADAEVRAMIEAMLRAGAAAE